MVAGAAPRELVVMPLAMPTALIATDATAAKAALTRLGTNAFELVIGLLLGFALIGRRIGAAIHSVGDEIEQQLGQPVGDRHTAPPRPGVRPAVVVFGVQRQADRNAD